MDRTDRAALAAWALLVTVAIWWGASAVAGNDLGLDAAPLAGRWRWQPGPGLIVPGVVAGMVVWWGPNLAARLPWRWVPVTAGAAGVAWATTLAASDGWDALARPLVGRLEYEQYAATITSAGSFVRDFVERQDGLPIHVKGHPPGATLVPWSLDAVGLGGVGWFAVLALLGWGVAIGAALVGARTVAGEATARRAAPALALLPAAVFAGTSADAVFAGVLATGIAVAVVGRRRNAVAGGVVLGGGLMLTYGATLLLALPGLAHLQRRRVLHAVLVGLGALGALTMIWAVTGFSWLEGLEGTRRAYWRGVGSRRPAGYLTALGNPGALALALGPAVVVGLVSAARRWRLRASLLPLAALAAVALADLSQLSKGEVERIWLPFMPWLALSAPGSSRWWLAAQAIVALTLQTVLLSRW